MTVTKNELPRWVCYKGIHWFNPGEPVIDGQISLWRLFKSGHGTRAPVDQVHPAEPHQAQTLDEIFKH